MSKDIEDNLDEAVLTLLQRQKRAQILRRNKAKLERAREISRAKLAPQKNIRNRAFKQARQILRRRVAGNRGAEYEKLGPSEKMNIDRMIDKKQKIIKKLALRLIPKVKQAEQKRLQAFYAGRGGLDNYGAPEAKHPPVNEAVNNNFAKKFNDDPNADANNTNDSRDKPVITNKKDKNSPVIMYSRFEDNGKNSKFAKEMRQESAIFRAILKKADDSNIDIEVLGEVYDRGYFGWNGGRGDPEQAAFARVNSYINQGKTYFNEDADLHELSTNTLQNYKGDAEWDRDYERGTEDDKTWQKRDRGIQLAKKKLKKREDSDQSEKPENIKEGRAPGNAYVKRMSQGGRDIIVSSTKWGKKKYWRDSVGGVKKAHEHAGIDPKTTGITSTNEETILEAKATLCGRCGTKHVPASKGGHCPAMKEEVQQTNENFIDGKGPGKPGDAQRHGLKGKSASELKKIRSSETASPRKKQLAHWMLNMHHNEEAELDEAAEKVVGTNCRNCSWWKPGSEKPVTKEELNKNGGLKAPNAEYVAMCKRIDLGTLPGEDHSVKVKGFCDHKEINDWVTERMCCSQWDADGMIRDYKGQSPVMKEEDESIIPQTSSPGSKIRKKIEVVDRAKPYKEYTRQAEVKTKIIDETHDSCGTSDCCGQCDTAVGNSQNDSGKRLVATDSLVKAYKKDTPGQGLNESFNIAYAAGIGQTYTAADLGIKMQGAFAYHPSILPESSSETQADKKPTTRGGYYNDEGEYVPLKATARRPGTRIIKTKRDSESADGEEQ